MPSFPNSPTSPHHHRFSSTDVPTTPISPQSPPFPPGRAHRSWSSSSQASAPTPRPRTSRQCSTEDTSFGSTSFANLGAQPESNGLGSLADELAEAWDEDEDEGIAQEEQQQALLSSSPSQSIRNDTTSPSSPTSSHRRRPQLQFHHDMGFGFAPPVEPSPPLAPRRPQNGLQAPPSPTQRRRTTHLASRADYDGSEYGSDTDVADPGPFISPSLDLRLSLVENLARQGTGALEGDALFERVTGELRELKVQVGVENGVTRLSTAHTALTTHLTHTTRLLTTLTQPLLSPLPFAPSLHPLTTTDPTLPTDLSLLLSDLLALLPYPSTAPLPSLQALQQSSHQLLATLTTLADTLHMLRQTQLLASRKLKAAQDLVRQIREEEEKRERGERWIEEEGWEARLKGREARRVCEAVLGGFEEVCRGWREVLVGAG